MKFTLKDYQRDAVLDALTIDPAGIIHEAA